MNTDRCIIVEVGRVFNPTGYVSSFEYAFPNSEFIYNNYFLCEEEFNYRPSTPSLYEVASHIKTAILHFGLDYYYNYNIMLASFLETAIFQ